MSYLNTELWAWRREILWKSFLLSVFRFQLQNEKKLFLMKERMTEHSDQDTFFKIKKLIERTLNEQS